MNNEDWINMFINKFNENKDYRITDIRDREKLLDELRPTGEWIDEGQYAEGHSEHAYICKKCGYQIIVTPNMIFEERFCKCCGARMKEGNE